MERIVIRDAAVAKEIEEITSQYQAKLIALLDKARATEQSADHHASALGIGEVLAALGSSILFPIYRMHPALTPESLKKTLEREKPDDPDNEDGK